MRQLRWFVLRRKADDTGAHLREHLDRRAARVDPVRRLPVELQVLDVRRLELEDVELVARRKPRHAGRGDAAERPRPRDLREAADLQRAGRVGCLVASYGAKFVVTWSRAGSTHFVSATIAIFAVISSPKRCTVGLTVAYALKGTPSPTDEPCWKIGQARPRRALRGRARPQPASDDALSRDRPAPHLAQVGPAEEGAEHLAESCVCTDDRLDAERAEVADEPVPPAPRSPRASRAASCSRQVDGNDAPGRRVGVRNRDPADVGEACAPRPGPGSSPGRAPSGARAPAARRGGRAARRSRRGRRRTPASAGRADARRGTRAPARRCRPAPRTGARTRRARRASRCAAAASTPRRPRSRDSR